MENFVLLVVWIVAFLLVLWGIRLVLSALPLPENIRQIVLVAVGIIGLYVIAKHFLPLVGLSIP